MGFRFEKFVGILGSRGYVLSRERWGGGRYRWVGGIYYTVLAVLVDKAVICF